MLDSDGVVAWFVGRRMNLGVVCFVKEEEDMLA